MFKVTDLASLTYRNKVTEQIEINECMGVRLALAMKESHFSPQGSWSLAGNQYTERNPKGSGSNKNYTQERYRKQISIFHVRLYHFAN